MCDKVEIPKYDGIYPFTKDSIKNYLKMALEIMLLY